MRRGFLILGPEGSGTRWLTRLFVCCGCYGDHHHEQRLDKDPPPADCDIVWRRSFPHGDKWPSVEALADQVEAWGRTPVIICVIRDMYAITRSQRRWQGRVFLDACAKIQNAYDSISHSAALLELPMFISIYDSHMRNDGYTPKFLEMLDLTQTIDIRRRDGNKKYYSEEGSE